MGICKYCGKEFDKKSLGGHVARCKLNPNYNETIKKDRLSVAKATKKFIENSKNKMKEHIVKCEKCGNTFTITCTDYKFENGKYKKHCSRKCANSRNMSVEVRTKISNSCKEYCNNREPKTYICKNCGKEFKLSETRGRKYCCDECRRLWMKNNIYNKSGGYRKGSGRGKSGWYKDIYCNSSWELAFVMYHLDNNLYIKRCDLVLDYIFNGKKHKYYPDFITDDGIIEIKGYETPQTISKKLQNPNVLVLYKNDMKKYLDYAITNYGKDYIKYYDIKN